MDMVGAAYKITAEFPAQQRYGLASQMQRAAVSIPANIAEGYDCLHRGDYVHQSGSPSEGGGGHDCLHRGDYVHPISIARGALAELETRQYSYCRAT